MPEEENDVVESCYYLYYYHSILLWHSSSEAMNCLFMNYVRTIYHLYVVSIIAGVNLLFMLCLQARNAYRLYALSSPEITFSIITHYGFMLCYSLKILGQIYMILISVLLQVLKCKYQFEVRLSSMLRYLERLLPCSVPSFFHVYLKQPAIIVKKMVSIDGFSSHYWYHYS